MKKRILSIISALTIVTTFSMIGCGDSNMTASNTSNTTGITQEKSDVESKTLTRTDVTSKLSKQSSSLSDLFNEFENLDTSNSNSIKIYGLKLQEKCTMYKDEALALKGTDKDMDEIIDLTVSAYDEYISSGKALVKSVDEDNVDYVYLAIDFLGSGNKYIRQSTEKINNLTKQ